MSPLLSRTLKASQGRLIAGGILMLIAILVALFLLPDASTTLEQKLRAKASAETARDMQKDRLAGLQHLADRIQRGQQTLSDLEARLPQGSSSELQWQLSGVLHDLSTKAGVQLQSVKYGQPSKEESKGTGLEAMQVEFTVSGIYPSIKAFMRDLEGSGLPFAMEDARLEESPEGARLTGTLRAFRKAVPKDAGDGA
jgi:Tfp pilus assembly protein PilO